MREIFIALVAAHGLVHIIGFLRAFKLMEGKNYKIMISRPMGLVWLAVFIMFEVVAYMLVSENQNWWILGSVTIIISQLLIIRYWHDAKFGTIPNIVIAFAIIVDFGIWHFSSQVSQAGNEVYVTEVSELIKNRACSSTTFNFNG